MMIAHDFDITDRLQPAGSENTVQVILRSSVLEGQKHLLGPISIGNSPSEECTFLRKAPHTYGWDILPRLVSAGLWRNVELQIIDDTHIRNVHFFVTRIDTANHTAQVYADVQITTPMERFDKMKAEGINDFIEMPFNKTQRITMLKDGKAQIDVDIEDSLHLHGFLETWKKPWGLTDLKKTVISSRKRNF